MLSEILRLHPLIEGSSKLPVFERIDDGRKQRRSALRPQSSVVLQPRRITVVARPHCFPRKCQPTALSEVYPNSFYPRFLLIDFNMTVRTLFSNLIRMYRKYKKPLEVHKPRFGVLITKYRTVILFAPCMYFLLKIHNYLS